ncbi:hypothetical protein [Rhodoblastus sp.]|uniref:hypothetical protein n=1 Tax=Rhodoblastus sp. TaxID=1962975 RepID=UPI003FD6FCE9
MDASESPFRFRHPDADPGRREGSRATRGFVFIGCPFHDQMLRTYARQIGKYSAGPNYIFVGPDKLTRNETKFLKEMNMIVVKAPLAQLVAKLG